MRPRQLTPNLIQLARDVIMTYGRPEVASHFTLPFALL
jgi:hypothetical protein